MSEAKDRRKWKDPLSSILSKTGRVHILSRGSFNTYACTKNTIQDRSSWANHVAERRL